MSTFKSLAITVALCTPVAVLMVICQVAFGYPEAINVLLGAVLGSLVLDWVENR